MKLKLQPSGANAFLIHKDTLDRREFTQLEYLEIADWPSSFSNVEFWSISDIAFDLPIESTIGPRKTRRVSFVLSFFIRAVFSPLFSRFVGLPLDVFLSWSVVGPFRRDLTLRLRSSKVRLFGNRRLWLWTENMLLNSTWIWLIGWLCMGTNWLRLPLRRW